MKTSLQHQEIINESLSLFLSFVWDKVEKNLLKFWIDFILKISIGAMNNFCMYTLYGLRF